MVFFPASIRKNTPAARLSHIDKFLVVFSTLFFLIFRTVSLESGGVRVNMLTRRFAFVPPYIGRMAKNFRAGFEISVLHLCLSLHFICLSFPASQNNRKSADKLSDG